MLNRKEHKLQDNGSDDLWTPMVRPLVRQEHSLEVLNHKCVQNYCIPSFKYLDLSSSAPERGGWNAQRMSKVLFLANVLALVDLRRSSSVFVPATVKMASARGAAGANPFHSLADLVKNNGIDGQIFSLPKEDLDDLLKELRLPTDMRVVMHAHIREWKKNPQTAHDLVKAEQEREAADAAAAAAAAAKAQHSAKSKKSAHR